MLHLYVERRESRKLAVVAVNTPKLIGFWMPTDVAINRVNVRVIKQLPNAAYFVLNPTMSKIAIKNSPTVAIPPIMLVTDLSK